VYLEKEFQRNYLFQALHRKTERATVARRRRFTTTCATRNSSSRLTVKEVQMHQVSVKSFLSSSFSGGGYLPPAPPAVKSGLGEEGYETSAAGAYGNGSQPVQSQRYPPLAYERGGEPGFVLLFAEHFRRPCIGLKFAGDEYYLADVDPKKLHVVLCFLTLTRPSYFYLSVLTRK
jgi:hypothetical protein